MGANPAQAASGLMALSIAMGLCGILLSAWAADADQRRLVDAGCGAAGASAMPEGGFPGGGRRLSV